MIAMLGLNQFRCQVKLGHGSEERVLPQWVSFSVSIRFKNLPQACLTDELTDTIDYQLLSNSLEELCESRPYKLIEKLGYDAYQKLLNILPSESQIQLTLTKEKPPIHGLEGGSHFVISDFEEGPSWPAK